jgi:hypothetical protein
MDGAGLSHMGCTSGICRLRRLRGGATLTNERDLPFSGTSMALYVFWPMSEFS